MYMVAKSEDDLSDLVVIQVYEGTIVETGEIVRVNYDCDWQAWDNSDITLDIVDVCVADGSVTLYDVCSRQHIKVDTVDGLIGEKTILRFDDRFSDIWLGIISHAEFYAFDDDMRQYRCIADKQEDGTVIVSYWQYNNRKQLEPVDEYLWGVEYYADNWHLDYNKSY